MDIWDAARDDDLSRMKELLQLYPKLLDAKQNDESGCTPLRLAARYGSVSCVKYLLEAGANPDIRCNNGFTPLYRAVEFGHMEAVRLLLEHRANPDIQAESMKTPLLLAVEKNNQGAVQSLLEAGANPDIQDKYGNTPLMLACEDRRPEIIDLLIKHNANPNVVNNSNKRACDYSVSSMSDRVYAYMRAYKPHDKTSGSAEREVTVLSTQSNLEKLDRILKKKNKAEAAAMEGEVWHYLPPTRMARVEVMPVLELRLKDIFDFESRRQTTVTEQLATGAMSAETQEFDNIKDKTLLEKALFRFNEAGGNADPEVIQTGHRTRNKGNLDELRKKGI